MKKKKINNKQKKEITEEEKASALSVFTEEEINFILKAINNNQDRFNTLIEKLIVLEKYRNTQEKLLKGNIKANKQKLNKTKLNLEDIQKKLNDKEEKKKRIIKDIQKIDGDNTKLKENINKIYKEMNELSMKIDGKSTNQNQKKY